VDDDRWLIDGMNVLGSRPDGWWRDRDAAVRRLVTRLQTFAAAQEVTVVFDGRPLVDLPDGPSGALTVHYAPVADDRIVDLVRAEPGGWRVVTSDRGLRERVSAAGAAVEGAGTFLRRLETGDGQ
jgi:predicted RNA-binding protein with PIN domain